MAKPLPCHQSLELTEAPLEAPVSLTEAKAHMRVDLASEDWLINDLILAATAMVDGQGMLGKALITQKWRQWVQQSPGEVRLIIGPVQVLNAVKYYDTEGVLQTDTLENYEVIGTPLATYLRPKSGFSWPQTQVRSDAIAIEYTSGYGDTAADVPAPIRQAIKMLVSHWYETRSDAVERGLENVPYGFESILNLYRGAWYG